MSPLIADTKRRAELRRLDMRRALGRWIMKGRRADLRACRIVEAA